MQKDLSFNFFKKASSKQEVSNSFFLFLMSMVVPLLLFSCALYCLEKEKEESAQVLSSLFDTSDNSQTSNIRVGNNQQFLDAQKIEDNQYTVITIYRDTSIHHWNIERFINKKGYHIIENTEVNDPQRPYIKRILRIEK